MINDLYQNSFTEIKNMCVVKYQTFIMLFFEIIETCNKSNTAVSNNHSWEKSFNGYFENNNEKYHKAKPKKKGQTTSFIAEIFPKRSN